MAADQILTLDQLRHVAKLSRLAMSDAELGTFTEQLRSILGYVDQLQQLEVGGVEPMAHAVPLHNVLREDEIQPPLPLDQVLRNAPDADPPFFKVPKVIGGDEDSAG